jgi:hypothetical protein
MKKSSLIFLGILAIFIFALLFTVIISFKVVKQTTDKINFGLKDNFQTLVRIPAPIPPETKSFDQTIYIWEMETTAGEVVKVRFTHDTAFAKNSQKIIATLEMEQGGDPSVFDKTLSALVADRQTIISITDSNKINLNANPEKGYDKIELTKSTSGKVIKVVWQFNKNVFVNKNQSLYEKIYSYPQGLLKGLYILQRGILQIFSA